MDPDTFHTIAGPTSAEPPRVRGSRFLADAVPVSSAVEAAAVLEHIRKREYNATHHVWAYVLGPDRAEKRSSDDGEPSGSSGVPVLRAIDVAGVTNVLVVISRYYGGTKLGTGGLSRAYGQAAEDALHAAAVDTMTVRLRVELRFPFDATSAAMRLVDRYDALIDSQSYSTEGTILGVLAKRSEADRLVAEFVDVTYGRGQARVVSGVGCTTKNPATS